MKGAVPALPPIHPQLRRHRTTPRKRGGGPAQHIWHSQQPPNILRRSDSVPHREGYTAFHEDNNVYYRREGNDLVVTEVPIYYFMVAHNNKELQRHLLCALSQIYKVKDTQKPSQIIRWSLMHCPRTQSIHITQPRPEAIIVDIFRMHDARNVTTPYLNGLQIHEIKNKNTERVTSNHGLLCKPGQQQLTTKSDAEFAAYIETRKYTYCTIIYHGVNEISWCFRRINTVFNSTQ